MAQLMCQFTYCTHTTGEINFVNRIHTGASGNVLINKKADRLSSYNIWDYAEGQDTYRKSMLVDLTRPPDKVSDGFFPAICQVLLLVSNQRRMCSAVIDKNIKIFALSLSVWRTIKKMDTRDCGLDGTRHKTGSHGNTVLITSPTR